MKVREIVRECVEQVHGALRAEYGRDPTMAKLIEVTGLSHETIRKACHELGLSRSLERKRRGSGGEGGNGV